MPIYAWIGTYSTRQLFQNLFPQLLGLAEKFLILDEHPIEFQRLVRSRMLAQNHVAHVDWVGEGCVFRQFFQRRIGIVVIHSFMIIAVYRLELKAAELIS